MDNIKRCSICGNQIEHTTPEKWEDPDGDVIEISRSKDASALLETSSGKYYICWSCYPERVVNHFSGKELAELHYQFGLDLNQRGDKSNTMICFQRSLEIERRAEVLASLAVCVTDRNESDKLNREALSLDPDCKNALWNLNLNAS
jgi:hypothetical protein